MPATVSLADLGVTEDPGTCWHPRHDKTEAWDGDQLADLSDAERLKHTRKPEAAEQIDAGEPLAAEDSTESPAGEV